MILLGIKMNTLGSKIIRNEIKNYFPNHIQEIHMTICQLICGLVKKELFVKK